MFCSTMMSPERVLSNRQLRSRAARVQSRCFRVGDASGLVIDMAEDGLADLAAVNALHAFLKGGLHTSLKIHQKAQPAPRFRAALQDGVAPRQVDGYRLSQVYVFAGSVSGRGLFGMVVRGAFDCDGIDLGGHQFPIAAETAICTGAAKLI